MSGTGKTPGAVSSGSGGSSSGSKMKHRREQNRQAQQRYRDKRKKELEELQGLLTTLEAAYSMMKTSYESAVTDLERVSAEKQRLEQALVESDGKNKMLELACRSLEQQVITLSRQMTLTIGDTPRVTAPGDGT